MCAKTKLQTNDIFPAKPFFFKATRRINRSTIELLNFSFAISFSWCYLLLFGVYCIHFNVHIYMCLCACVRVRAYVCVCVFVFHTFSFSSVKIFSPFFVLFIQWWFLLFVVIVCYCSFFFKTIYPFLPFFIE